MRLALTYGREKLYSTLAGVDRVTVEQALKSLAKDYPEIYKQLCNRQGCLRASLLVFINGKHIRYLNGMATEVQKDDKIHIIPFITGG